jgi:hypothetical protein
LTFDLTQPTSNGSGGFCYPVTGTFTISGGTGVFANATGSGTATFSRQPDTTTAQGGAVIGTETFDTLRLHL